jgi:PIN domain nuclease of toxin-antitoxin system
MVDLELGRAIKSDIGKLSLTPTYRDFLQDVILSTGLKVLEITFDDCCRYERLPFPNPQQRDPYDRMIVAHALQHGLSIVSVDEKLDGYGATRLWT